MNSCPHDFSYQGMEYWHDAWPRPGSSAHTRRYVDVYFCTRCLQQERRNERAIGTNYDQALPNSTPRGDTR
jgi:hypothetical protein